MQLLPSTMQHALALAVLSLQLTSQELSGKILVKYQPYLTAEMLQIM